MKKTTLSLSRSLRLITVVGSALVCSGISYAQTDYTPNTSNRVTQLITDYGGFWQSSSVNHEVQPNNRHHLVAFEMNGTLFSTGVNDALLVDHELPFTPAQFHAFPFATIGGNHPGGAVYLVTGRDMDGDPNQALVNSYIIQNMTVKDALTDGIRGLDISTGVTNLANNVPMTYSFQIPNIAVVNDEIPDFLFSQIGEVGYTNNDRMELLNAEGEVVGNAVVITFAQTPSIGRYNMDFFTYPANQPYDTNRPTGTNAGGYNYRDLRLLAVRLSDFGITADNFQEVVGMQIHKGGVNDPAFYAFNQNSLVVAQLPIITQNPQSQMTCTDGTASVTFNVEAQGDDLTYEWRFNNQPIEGATESSYTINEVTDAHSGFYHVMVRNEFGEVQSTHAFLNNRHLVNFADRAICENTSTQVVVNTLSSEVTFQWYRHTENTYEGAEAIEGEVSEMLEIHGTEPGIAYYFVQISQNDMPCSFSRSNIFKCTVNPAPVMGEVAATTATTICTGGSVTFAITGHQGNVRWQYANATTPTTWVNATGTGSTSANYTATNINTPRFYRAAISRTSCTTLYSDIIEVQLQTDNHWVGNANSTWAQASNWSCGIVPNANQSVHIPAGAAYYPTVGDLALRDLTIEEGATMTLNGTLTLTGNLTVHGELIGTNLSLELANTGEQTLSGNFAVNKIIKTTANPTVVDGQVYVTRAVEMTTGTLISNGNLTFGSSATHTAIAQLSGDAVIEGEVVVERYITNRSTFRALATSVSGGSIYENWQENGQATSGYGTMLAGVAGTAGGFDTQSDVEQLFQWDHETDYYQAIPSTLEALLSPGNGYFMYVNGDRTTTPEAETTATRLRSRGELQQTDFAYPHLNAHPGGFSLIGNPFQNQLDVQQMLAASTGLNKNFVWMWDAQINSQGAYVIIDLENNTSNNMSSNAFKNAKAGEAFWVQTLDADPSLLAATSYQTHSNQEWQTFDVSSTIRFTLMNQEFASVDGLLIRVAENYSNQVDENDAVKMVNPNENVGVLMDGSVLGIASIAQPVADQRIPFNTNQLTDQTYYFLYEFNGYMGPQAYLYDHMNDSYTALAYEGIYEFTGSPNDVASRFELVFEPEVLGTTDWNAHTLRIYPNPVNAQNFTIDLSQHPFKSLRMYNVLGQEVGFKLTELGNQLFVESAQTWPAGIYTLVIETQGQTLTRPIIVR